MKNPQIYSLLGGIKRWLQRKCPLDVGSAVHPGHADKREIGTELDWLRFLWDFHDSSSRDGPNLGELMVLTRYAFEGEHRHSVGREEYDQKFSWTPSSVIHGLCDATVYGDESDVESEAGYSVDLTSFTERLVETAQDNGVHSGIGEDCLWSSEELD